MNEEKINKLIKDSEVDTSLISDGYHTFGELYEFRLALNANLFNIWSWLDKNELTERKYDVHKSKKHHDGEDCFGGGWFIVMAETIVGQVSFHYKLENWEMFDIPEKEKANIWDGHTSQEALQRLIDLSLQSHI